MRAVSLALLALLAACALAAPTPFRAFNHGPPSHGHGPQDRSFKFSVKPRFGANRSPIQELVRTYAKYGWQIIIAEPSNPSSVILGGDDESSSSSSSAVPAPTATPSPSSTNTAESEAVSIVTTTAIVWTPYVSTQSSAAKGTATASASSAKPATSTASGDVGEVSAVPENNESEYLSPVTIGGQSLNLDFDTGSADFWVFSSSLSSSEIGGHTAYDPSQSSTFEKYDGASWQITYGDSSSASGTVGYDVVDIGGATVTRQAVELATAVSGSFIQDTNNDGLVGLGFSTINTVEPQQQKTFFENVMPSLALPLFTADLKEDASGTYTFGSIDHAQYAGDIHYVDIDSSAGFWQFDSASYTVGDGASTPCKTSSPSIADTGTSLMLVDEDIAAAYYAAVAGSEMSTSQGGYIYPCDATLPDFGVALGEDYTATIKGAGVTFAPLGDGTCFGGIQGNAGQGLQIYGDVLFKNFFAVFDGGAKRFGLASKVEDGA
ncbi:hypothetical protein LTR53_004560 [Teratosphaeriaceae sp. CCFEE 6253]|nr:hypothetical protein LTR53_004560 [Teratosphaeriaceae sp. CCFEE 6253]